MLFTTHAITGAALGVATKDPYAAVAAGWLLHHAIDALPHFDQGSFYTKKAGVMYLGIEGDRDPRFSFSKRDWRMLFIDWGVAGIIYIYLFATVPLTLWLVMCLGTFGSLLPDIIDSSPLWSKKLRDRFSLIRKYHAFHVFFHWTVAQKEIWIGILTQIALLGVSLWYLASV